MIPDSGLRQPRSDQPCLGPAARPVLGDGERSPALLAVTLGALASLGLSTARDRVASPAKTTPRLTTGA